MESGLGAHDDRTLGFYAAEADAYTSRDTKADPHLDGFLQFVREGGRVLEFGCGGGQDSEYMIARGFDAVPTDGVPEIARAAEKRLGRPVRVLRFADLDDSEEYDGVWANACLLHVPRDELAPIIAAIYRALKPGGAFYASYKSGTAGGRDRFDRYYNYPSSEWLRAVYEATPWQRLDIVADTSSGYDEVPTGWLHATAIKPR